MIKVDLNYFATHFNVKRQKVIVTDTECTEHGFIVSVGKPSKNCTVYLEREIGGVINACKPDIVCTAEHDAEAEKWAGLVGAEYRYGCCDPLPKVPSLQDIAEDIEEYIEGNVEVLDYEEDYEEDDDY
jgi:hypothetical protein